MTTNNIVIDRLRGRDVAKTFLATLARQNVLAKKEMPEDNVPSGVRLGSLDHMLFISLTVSIDYMRDADDLWASARSTYEDPETRYLFSSKEIYEVNFTKIVRDMQKHGLSRKIRRDAHIWRTVALTFLKKWAGDPRKFINACRLDALEVLSRLKTDTHLMNGRPAYDYPNLRGDKIGPLWIRMLRDNIGLSEIRNIEKVPIPVDVHVARSTLALGVVRGKYRGPLGPVFQEIRKAWFEATERLNFGRREMIALDMDQPLWNLSKYGCTNRLRDRPGCPRSGNCPAKAFCIPGVIVVSKSSVELET